MSNLDLLFEGKLERLNHAGIECLVAMGPFSINGYIELPEGHPWLVEGDVEGDVSSLPDEAGDVHGGATFYSFEHRILGFDTNHLTDLPHPESPQYSPKVEHMSRALGAHTLWRTKEAARSEAEDWVGKAAVAGAKSQLD